jgi:hypothetical protein
MPEITVYMNCDTCLAINLRMFSLSNNDELIFIIKNYNYIDSPYAFMFRAKNTDMNENGEVIFKITPAISKRLKPGAFYNFAVLLNAFDKRQETEYKKLTDNGNILLEYGAQDLLLGQEVIEEESNFEVISVRLEPTNSVDLATRSSNEHHFEVVGMRLEEFVDDFKET